MPVARSPRLPQLDLPVVVGLIESPLVIDDVAVAIQPPHVSAADSQWITHAAGPELVPLSVHEYT